MFEHGFKQVSELDSLFHDRAHVLLDFPRDLTADCEPCKFFSSS